MKIMLSAGEASGDVHGENIARAILSMAPETELIGFGGTRMENAGVRLRQNFADYSVMGVWEVLVNIRRLFKLLNDLTDFMREEQPDMLSAGQQIHNVAPAPRRAEGCAANCLFFPARTQRD